MESKRYFFMGHLKNQKKPFFDLNWRNCQVPRSKFGRGVALEFFKGYNVSWHQLLGATLQLFLAAETYVVPGGGKSPSTLGRFLWVGECLEVFELKIEMTSWNGGSKSLKIPLQTTVGPIDGRDNFFQRINFLPWIFGRFCNNFHFDTIFHSDFSSWHHVIDSFRPCESIFVGSD